MMLTVTENFTRRRAPVALIVTFLVAITGMALVAYFASDLVEFASTSASAAPDYYPTPIMRAP